MSTKDQLIRDLTGCYILSAQGTLGRLQQGGFTEDPDASAQLAAVVAIASQTLENDPFNNSLLISLVVPAGQDKPWKSPTILFTDHVVETLYPVHGVRTGVLTTFQKRNREHSVYQGMELLLNYRRETFPDRPVFCPLLLDRGRPFSSYEDLLVDRSIAEAQRDAPTVEVINLFGLTPSEDPNYALIAELCSRIVNSAINKKMRKDLDFGFDAGVPAASAQPGQATTSTDNEPTNPFSQAADPRADSIPFSLENDQDKVNTPPPAQFVAEPAAPSSFTPPPAQSSNPFTSSEEIHPDHLRRFALFAALDHDRLGRLAMQLSMESASPGTQLIARGSVDQWYYFLLDGMVALRAGDGNSRRIEAGSTPAQQPLSRLLPRKYDVSAMTAIKYIRIHKTVLEQFVSL